MRVLLHNQPLFIRKLTMLAGATLAIIPLVYLKLDLPAQLYVLALLIMHLFIFYIYLRRTPWKSLWQHKVGFISRLTALGLFSWLLTTLRYAGSLYSVAISLVTALIVHAAILLALHLRVEKNPKIS